MNLETALEDGLVDQAGNLGWPNNVPSALKTDFIASRLVDWGVANDGRFPMFPLETKRRYAAFWIDTDLEGRSPDPGGEIDVRAMEQDSCTPSQIHGRRTAVEGLPDRIP